MYFTNKDKLLQNFNPAIKIGKWYAVMYNHENPFQFCHNYPLLWGIQFRISWFLNLAIYGEKGGDREQRRGKVSSGAWWLLARILGSVVSPSLGILGLPGPYLWSPGPFLASQGSRCAPWCYALAPFLPLPLYLSFLIHLLWAGFLFLRLCGPILSLTDEKNDAERGGGIHPRSHSELEMAYLSSSKRRNQPSRTLTKSAWWVDTRGK